MNGNSLLVLEQALIKSGHLLIWVNEMSGEQVQVTECQSRVPLIMAKYKDQKPSLFSSDEITP